MPPKNLKRPARAGGVLAPGVKAKAKAKAAAKVVPRRAVRRRLRRPAGAGDNPGARGGSEAFEEGSAVAPRALPLETWQAGLSIAVVKGTYWEEEVKVAGTVKELICQKDQVLLRVALSGTQSESILKWAGKRPNELLELDLCGPDCPRLSKDGLVHCQLIQKVTADKREDWMDNLVTGATGRDEQDEMEKLRRRAEEHRKMKGDRKSPLRDAHEQVSSDSSEKQEKEKKKKKKKKKKDRVKVDGTKELSVVFGKTALDPEPGVRRKLKRAARRLARKRGRKGSSDSSRGTSSSEGSESSAGAGARLFGEEVRVKSVSRKYPGALTLSAVEMMQSAVVMQTGQPWDLDRAAIPPSTSDWPCRPG